MTPLWCAAVANKLEVVKFLAEWGANINATSDSQSTPVRSACFMTNIEVRSTKNNDVLAGMSPYVIPSPKVYLKCLLVF